MSSPSTTDINSSIILTEQQLRLGLPVDNLQCYGIQDINRIVLVGKAGCAGLPSEIDLQPFLLSASSSQSFQNIQLHFPRLKEVVPKPTPPSSFPKASEIKRQAAAHSKSIFKSWNFLNQLLARRDDEIRKRWSKKSRMQRKTILLNVWPHIPKVHRPELHITARGAHYAQRGSSASQAQLPLNSETKARNEASFRWPYINLVDLVQEKPLLLLLNSRGRNPPHLFAHADHHSMSEGRSTGEIPIVDLQGHTMYLSGQTAEESYGRIFKFEDEEVSGLIGQTLQFQPGHGLAVLESQDKLLDFLVKFCRRIFHDTPERDILGLDIPPQAELASLATNDTVSYPKLSSLAEEAPYRLPARTDVGHLLNLVEARLADAEDHIWELREDPGCFMEYLGDHEHHRPEKLLDNNGKSHPHTGDDVFWGRVLSCALVHAYEDLLFWNLLIHDIQALNSKIAEFPGNFNPHERLPANIEEALVDVYRTLYSMTCIMVERLKIAVACSHSMRKNFFRNLNKLTGSGEGKAGFHNSIVKIIYGLSPKKAPSVGSMHTAVDRIQYLLDHDKTQKELFTDFTASIFSDLALLTQCADQIDIFYPWAQTFVHSESKKPRGPLDLRANLERGVGSLCQNPKNLLTPIRAKFHYPLEKSYSAMKVETMRNAEANLDEVWSTIDVIPAQEHGISLRQLFYDHAQDHREIRRTPVYVAPEPRPPKTETVVEAIQTKFPELNLSSDDGRLEKVSPPKQKVKTRGIARPPDQDNHEGANHDEGIPVDRAGSHELANLNLSERARRVLSTVFCNNRERQRGEISWKDFLHSMASLKFSVEHLEGIEWRFTPTMGENRRSVIIHAPHPSDKIPFKRARRVGRRLMRIYGWDEKTFDLD